MEFKASHRYAPMSARKARPVIDMVRGLGVNRAIETLRTTHRRAAVMIDKVIRSAVANAEQIEALDADQLYVKEAFVNEGPLKQGRMRWRPGAMGRIKPIRKRTSHIVIRLGVIEDAGGSRRAAPTRDESATESED